MYIEILHKVFKKNERRTEMEEQLSAELEVWGLVIDLTARGVGFHRDHWICFIAGNAENGGSQEIV